MENTLGEHLRKLRKERGLSTSAASLYSNGRISQPFLSQIETGKHQNVSLQIILTLCDIYKVTPNELLAPLVNQTCNPFIVDTITAIQQAPDLPPAGREALLSTYRAVRKLT